jgi:hypothetical protein
MRKLAIEVLFRTLSDAKPSATIILPDDVSQLDRQAIAEAVLRLPAEPETQAQPDIEHAAS